MKTVLITGVAGFLGSHLAEEYRDRGCRVIGYDNFVTGREENLSDLLDDENFTLLTQDVTEYLDLEILPWFTGEEDLDVVFHFASPASPDDYREHPIKTLKVGSLGTHNSLGVAKRYNARFVLASTSEVYGDPEVHPQPESYYGHVNQLGDRGVYDEAKRFSEAITMAYNRKHEVNTGIVRIFNTYGPRMRLDDGRVVPNFMKQALLDKPLTVYGDGEQTRSFCYVDDLIEGISRLADSDYHQPVNIGNNREMTILEFAETVLEITDSTSELEFYPLPEDDPKVRCPDLSRANKILDWQPKYSLKEGLKKTLPYYKNRVRD